MHIEDKKIHVDNWFSYLQAQICGHFEKIENDKKSYKSFVSKNWYKSV